MSGIEEAEKDAGSGLAIRLRKFELCFFLILIPTNMRKGGEKGLKKINSLLSNQPKFGMKNGW